MSVPIKLIEEFNPILKAIGVTRVAEISSYEDIIIYVYQSIRPSSHNLIVDSGKGVTPEKGYTSCCVEAIERYTAENFINEIDLVSTECVNKDIKIKMIKGILVNELKCCKGFNISNPDKVVYIPIDLLKYNNDSSHIFDIKLFTSGTTGLGSHYNKESAIASGLSECLERDAIASDLPKYEIEKKSLNKYFAKYISWINEINPKYRLIYHQSNHPIYAFSVLGDDHEIYGGLVGMGSGLNPLQALENALIESIQTWVMRVSASRDDWCFAKTGLNPAPKYYKKKSFCSIKNHDVILNSNNDLINYIYKTNLPIYAIKMIPAINTNPILTYKVIAPTLNDLQQGYMLTGNPRSDSYNL